MRNQHWSSKGTILLIIITFAIVGMMLTMQFSKVMVYYDDYAYYSLSYAESFVHTGNHYTLTELCAFLKAHYVDCNGRLLYFFVWLLIYMVGGIEAVQIAAAGITLAVLMCLWYTSIDNRESAPIPAAILICTLFGLFDIDIHRFGTFWFAAFFHYVMPVIPTILLIHSYFKKRKTSLSFFENVCMVMLTVCAAFSQEQLAVTITALALLLLAYEFFNHNIRIINFEILATAALSLVVIMSSPGIQTRGSAFSDPFAVRLYSSIYQLISMFFGENRLMVVALLSAMAGISLSLFRNNKGKDLCWIDIISAVVYTVVGICSFLGYNLWNNQSGISQAVVVMTGLALVVLTVVQVTRYYIVKESYTLLTLFFAAVLSIACLCVVPELPIRLLLPSWLLLFPLIQDGFFELSSLIVNSKDQTNNCFTWVICIIFVSMAVPNALSIYQGYSKNYEALYCNDLKLQKYAENTALVDDVIVLRKIPDALHRVQVVHDEGFESMAVWMNRYYGLPENTTYEFTEAGDPVGNTFRTALFNQGIYMDGWVESSAELEIYSGDLGLIEIEGYYPGSITGNEQIRIFVGGQETMIYQINNADFVISIPVVPNNRLNICLESNFMIEVTPPEQRPLSWLICNITGK